MSLYQLKPAFQKILRPIVILLNKCNITPNFVTISTCLLSCIFSYFLFLNKDLLIFVPLFFFLRMALNAIDGMLAKEFQQTTNLGAILNELTDVISDTALYFSLSAHSLVSIDVLLLFIFLSNLSEFAGLSALSISKERRFDGPLGKSDRALFISLVALQSHYFTFQTSTMNYVFYAANILLIITIIKRVKNALS